MNDFWYFMIEIETDLGALLCLAISYRGPWCNSGTKENPAGLGISVSISMKTPEEKIFLIFTLALSILLRQSNKRNYYTMMLSHTVFSTLRMHQTSRVSRKAKFGSLEAKKMFNLIIIMMSWARLTRLKNDAKKNLQIIWFAFWLLSNFLFNHTVIGWWKGKTSTIF